MRPLISRYRPGDRVARRAAPVHRGEAEVLGCLSIRLCQKFVAAAIVCCSHRSAKIGRHGIGWSPRAVPAMRCSAYVAMSNCAISVSAE